jgi:hypothetical protein
MLGGFTQDGYGFRKTEVIAGIQNDMTKFIGQAKRYGEVYRRDVCINAR